ncbi:PTS sugar transporter subunit IIB [Enterocloster citroniae]|uniref:PTS sugar transporter subunit IIB n=1 Tax=Enterocloster citroniae TaxID=358743 RepID=UPI001D069DEC|nr:PTS sugar transporter subunit IIB [Enterocloster citroniae]MCB7064188.1 PTS sugar transporter subunit IIB [Enterocloster citroniae]
MKRILLVCGSGICTSTAVNQKVSKALDERGLKGQYKITQGKASEVAGQSSNYDLCISTTVLGGECYCPLIIGTQFLLGRNTEKLVDEIVEILSR